MNFITIHPQIIFYMIPINLANIYNMVITQTYVLANVFNVLVFLYGMINKTKKVRRLVCLPLATMAKYFMRSLVQKILFHPQQQTNWITPAINKYKAL